MRPAQVRGEVRGEVHGEVRGQVRGEVRGEVHGEVRGEVRGKVCSDLEWWMAKVYCPSVNMTHKQSNNQTPTILDKENGGYL